MRIILFAFCTLVLLAATGCIFPGGRDHYDRGDDRGGDHWHDHDDHHGDWDRHDNR